MSRKKRKKIKATSKTIYRLSILIAIIGLFFLGSLVFNSLNRKDAGASSSNLSSNIKSNTGKLATKDAEPEDNKKNSPNNKNIKNTPSTEAYTEVLLNSVGDCTLGNDDKFSYQGSLPHTLKKNNNDYSYIFKNVNSIFSSDDITIANFEGTLTTYSQKAEKQFTFKAPPEYAKILTLGSIEGVNISNNHTRDYLEKGFQDTKLALKAENINYFGEGSTWIKDVKGTKFGFLGYKGYYSSKELQAKIKKDIQNLKDQNRIVIINFHWGEEGSYHPNSTQKSLAHFAIDNGADLIIGHHPHVLQGIEKYKNKIICYSLGNFAFGGNKNPSDKDTMIVQVKFKFKNNSLDSYDLKVIPCTISSVNYTNDYKPTVAQGNKKTAILDKLNKISPNLGFKLDGNFHNIPIE
ncbi:CapA family protein [Clostridium sp. JNZ J1-5]|nr:CapA family protein [Clostridium sp.]